MNPRFVLFLKHSLFEIIYIPIFLNNLFLRCCGTVSSVVEFYPSLLFEWTLSDVKRWPRHTETLLHAVSPEAAFHIFFI